MIDFPSNPTQGQQFQASGVTWTWDGSKWTASGLGVAYLPLAGGTMLGPIVLAADPAAPLQAATKQYVDANYSGFVNKFRNGTFDIWQRGNVDGIVAGSTVYTADGWIAFLSGAAFNAESPAATSLPTPSWGPIRHRKVYQLWPSVSGGTNAVISQRIESYIAAALKSQIVTVQVKIFNNGPTFTPTLTVQTPTAADNFGSMTNVVSAAPLQNCPSSAWTQLAYTFNVGSNADLGLSVFFQIGNALNIAPSNWVALAEADIRATPGWPVGLCANPPPPELRPIATELAFCQRYYEVFSQSTGDYTNLPSGGGYVIREYPFKVQKRAAPTLTYSGWNYWDNAGNTHAFTPNVTSGSIYTVVVGGTGLTNAVGLNAGTATASAEL